VQQVTFEGNVRLMSFKLGASGTRTCSVVVMDLLDGTVLYDESALSVEGGVPLTVSGPWASTTGIVLHVGPDLFNVVIDDISIQYSKEGTFPTTTTTTTTVAPTTTPVPGTEHVFLDFSGPICDDGACSDGSKIDQSYGDTPYLDVQYAAGLPLDARGTIAPAGDPFEYWESFGGLEDVAYGESASTLQQIFFRGNVTLRSFQLGSWTQSARSVTISIVDAGNNTILNTTTYQVAGAPLTVHGEWSSADGIAIQGSEDFYLVCIDNIFVVVDTFMPLPQINTTTVLTTTALPTTTTMPPPTAPPGPTVVSYFYKEQRNVISLAFTITATPGNVLACFVDFNTDTLIPQARVNGEIMPLVSRDRYPRNPRSTDPLEAHALISFFWRVETEDNVMQLSTRSGTDRGGTIHCAELAGVTGLDTFRSSVGFRTSTSIFRSTSLTTLCPSTTILTGVFATDGSSPRTVPGTRLSSRFDIGSLSARTPNEAGELQFLGSIWPEAVDAGIAAIAFSACPTTSSSCLAESCVCGGAFCQSNEALSLKTLEVSPLSSLLAPELAFEPNSTLAVNVNETFFTPMIQTTGGSGIELGGTSLVLTLGPGAVRSAQVVVAQTNGGAEIKGQFDAVTIVSSNPCEEVQGQGNYLSSSASVLLTYSESPSCSNSGGEGGGGAIVPGTVPGFNCTAMPCFNDGVCMADSGVCMCTSEWEGARCGEPRSTATELSGGAVAGIAIGAIVVGAAIAVAIILFFRWRQKQTTAAMKNRLKEQENDDLKSPRYAPETTMPAPAPAPAPVPMYEVTQPSAPLVVPEEAEELETLYWGNDAEIVDL
jgi:hypothetical protein